MSEQETQRAIAWRYLRMAAMTMGREFTLTVGNHGVTVALRNATKEVSQHITWAEMERSNGNPLTRAMSNMIMGAEDAE